jgi:hypothetical protein
MIDIKSFIGKYAYSFGFKEPSKVLNARETVNMNIVYLENGVVCNLDTVSFDGPVKMFEIIEQKTEVAVPN